MNTSLRQVSVSLVTATILIGCTRVRVTAFDPQAPSVQRTNPDDIRFYETQRPRCEFRELGHISSHARFFAPWSTVIRKTRERASEMGGDAVIAIRESTRISGGTISPSGVTATETTTLSGTVIRFTNRGCRA
jgi:hypothetical protein